MADISPKTVGSQPLGGWIWLALGLFAVFFLGVAIQRFAPGWLEVPAAMEAALLVIATACFISGCLRLESRQSSRPKN